MRKSVLKAFVKLTGKHLCWSLFFGRDLQINLKEAPTQVFSCEFCEAFTNTFFIEYLCVTACVPQRINYAINSN